MDDKRFESEAILEKIDELDDHTKAVFHEIHLASLSTMIEIAYSQGDVKTAEGLLNVINNSIGHAEKYVSDRAARKRELEEKYRGEIEM